MPSLILKFKERGNKLLSLASQTNRSKSMSMTSLKPLKKNYASLISKTSF